MVEYSDNGKYAFIDGLTFCRDEKTGYYLNSTIHKRLHRYVYERENGPIQPGFHVHHKDHDRGNNEPENLELLSAKDHSNRHREEMPDELREWYRENMLKSAIPKAKAWHKSGDGREWHKQHYDSVRSVIHREGDMVCKQCGKLYQGIVNGKNAFCSNVCKSAWRRKEGIDNVERECTICGRTFTANKYSETVCCSRSCAMRLRGKNLRNQKTAAAACL